MPPGVGAGSASRLLLGGPGGAEPRRASPCHPCEHPAGSARCCPSAGGEPLPAAPPGMLRPLRTKPRGFGGCRRGQHRRSEGSAAPQTLRGVYVVAALTVKTVRLRHGVTPGAQQRAAEGTLPEGSRTFFWVFLFPVLFCFPAVKPYSGLAFFCSETLRSGPWGWGLAAVGGSTARAPLSRSQPDAPGSPELRRPRDRPPARQHLSPHRCHHQTLPLL